MLAIKNLSKTFGKTLAVDDISFEVNSGSIFGILGPNGAGKSTILRSILNIIEKNEGSILVDGIPNSDYSLDKIGYLPEDRGLYQRSKVKDVLKYFGKLKSLNSNELNTKIEYWADKFNLSELLNRNIYELSKGNQQKVQFLISIIHDPKILILDEPFTGFDPINQQLILEIINSYKVEGKIVIISTHMLELAEKFCTEILLINRGQKIISGDLIKIKSEYSKELYFVEINGDDQMITKNHLIKEIENINGKIKITAAYDCKSSELLKYLSSKVEVLQFYKIEPSLSDIFLDLISNSNK